LQGAHQIQGGAQPGLLADVGVNEQQDGFHRALQELTSPRA
jgi:hypothetical protein